MTDRIYSPTQEEKKEARQTANKILGYFHELSNEEKAFLIHTIVMKFSKMSEYAAKDLINKKSFLEKEDETNKN